jgi:hypothetical protein
MKNMTEYEIWESKRIRTNKHTSKCEQCDNFVERVKWKILPILHLIPAHPLGDTHMAREEHPHWLKGREASGADPHCRRFIPRLL